MLNGLLPYWGMRKKRVKVREQNKERERDANKTNNFFGGVGV